MIHGQTALPEGIPVLVSDKGGMADAVEYYGQKLNVFKDLEPRNLNTMLKKFLSEPGSRMDPMSDEDINNHWFEIGILLSSVIRSVGKVPASTGEQ